ncbi:MAG: hypothetical protein WBI07_11310 [Mobilitalea sp.]
MEFKFDMQGKSSKRELDKKINNYLILVIDKDICPTQDNIIMKGQCTGCEYYKDFTMYNGQPCIICSNKLSNGNMN